VKRMLLVSLLALIALSACAGPASETEVLPTATKPLKSTNTPPPTATPFVTATPMSEALTGYPGLPLPVEQDELFSTSGVCQTCHANIKDETGADISLDAYWRSTMMANAARDPYWQASVQAEVLTNPQHASVIEEKCATCHMPMASLTLESQDAEALVLGSDGLLSGDHDLHAFALDGVSCAVCHQIRETGLGTAASYSGGFIIDTELRAPDRIIFGPYTIGEGQARIMQSGSGYRPEQGLHITQSELCATCHTLYTPTVDATGAFVGEFPEQVPYFEWFYSDYRRTNSCQDCHMPEAQGGAKIANTSRVLRSPFLLHNFVGGNVYMLEMMKTFSEEIGMTASSDQLQATIDRTLDQLQNRTATISLEDVRRAGSRIYADVVVENLAGHKFPTGFPARRAWIRFVVTDGSGQVVFESGAHNPDGSIVDNDNDDDPGMVEQHYLAVVQPSQVQIYEAILQDTERKVTTTLLEAAAYRKDNRLLPSGFEKSAPYEDIAVRGEAREDVNFVGGGDKVEYIASIGDAAAPFTVQVELLYQSISFRWAENLSAIEDPNIASFGTFYDNVPNLPIVIASDTVEIGN
jgi:mono/diheme cytochrome c family protein